MKKLFATVWVVWCLGLLSALAFWGTVAYVAHHFLSKWW